MGTLADERFPRKGRKSVDLTGKRFGKLVAIKYLGLREFSYGKRAYWLCQCDCGKQCEVSANALQAKSGARTTCTKCTKRPGRPHRLPGYDLTGQVFSELTVVEYAGIDKIGNHCWECKCSCGETCVASTVALRTGNKRSCGHLYAVKNKYYTIGDVGVCLLSSGEYFWFDDRDYDLISAYQWSTQQGYAYTHVNYNGRKTTYRLIRLLFGLAPSSKYPVVDHINGDIRDNRRCNLRLCSNKENVRHRSGVKGWYLERKSGRYFSRITVNGKIIHLGMFATKDEATAAYRVASKKYHGDFRAYEKVVWFPGWDNGSQSKLDLCEWSNYLQRYVAA